MFSDPILNLFTGKGNPKSQHTASMYIQELIGYLCAAEDNEMFNLIAEKIFKLFLVINHFLFIENFVETEKELCFL